MRTNKKVAFGLLVVLFSFAAYAVFDRWYHTVPLYERAPIAPDNLVDPSDPGTKQKGPEEFPLVAAFVRTEENSLEFARRRIFDFPPAVDASECWVIFDIEGKPDSFERDSMVWNGILTYFSTIRPDVGINRVETHDGRVFASLYDKCGERAQIARETAHFINKHQSSVTVTGRRLSEPELSQLSEHYDLRPTSTGHYIDPDSFAARIARCDGALWAAYAVLLPTKPDPGGDRGTLVGTWIYLSQAERLLPDGALRDDIQARLNELEPNVYPAALKSYRKLLAYESANDPCSTD